MKGPVTVDAFTRIAVYVPLAPEESGSLAELMATPSVSRIIALLQRVEFAGRVGSYRAVIEMSEGVESYMPTVDASPVHGDTGRVSYLRTVKVVTYVPSAIDQGAVDALVQDLASVHPWEHPVIELDTVRLWMPSQGVRAAASTT
jgi:hypothetical protein